jgi:3-methyladenine DNA glycosylase Mpg
VTHGALHFEPGEPARAIDVTPRIGVVGGEELRLRYCARGDPHLSR